jgi:hypothetical protein
MSCYFRHIKDTFSEVGIEVTPSNKKKIDQLIHELVAVEYKNCPETGRKVKELKQSETTWTEFKKILKSKWAEIT